MSGQLAQGVLWLVMASVFLLDMRLVIGVFGSGLSPSAREGWLAYPLIYTVGTLLLTPWRGLAAVAVGVAVAGHLIVHIIWKYRLNRQLAPAPNLTNWVADLARRWQGARPTQVRVSVGAEIGPACVGLFRPTLVLPGSLANLPDVEQRAVVAHELAHALRRDPLKVWAMGVARTLLGWHPAARRAISAIGLEMELAADRQAAAWLDSREQYALALGHWGLRAASSGGLRFGTALVTESSALVVRMQSLLDPLTPVPYLGLPAWMPVRMGRSEPVRRPWVARVVIGWIGLGYPVAYLLLRRWL